MPPLTHLQVLSGGGDAPATLILGRARLSRAGAKLLDGFSRGGAISLARVAEPGRADRVSFQDCTSATFHEL